MDEVASQSIAFDEEAGRTSSADRNPLPSIGEGITDAINSVSEDCQAAMENVVSVVNAIEAAAVKVDDACAAVIEEKTRHEPEHVLELEHHHEPEPEPEPEHNEDRGREGVGEGAGEQLLPVSPSAPSSNFGMDAHILQMAVENKLHSPTPSQRLHASKAPGFSDEPLRNEDDTPDGWPEIGRASNSQPREENRDPIPANDSMGTGDGEDESPRGGGEEEVDAEEDDDSEVVAGGFLWDEEVPVFTSPTGTAEKGGDDTEGDSEDEDEGPQETNGVEGEEGEPSSQQLCTQPPFLEFNASLSGDADDPSKPAEKTDADNADVDSGPGRRDEVEVGQVEVPPNSVPPRDDVEVIGGSFAATSAERDPTDVVPVVASCDAATSVAVLEASDADALPPVASPPGNLEAVEVVLSGQRDVGELGEGGVGPTLVVMEVAAEELEMVKGSEEGEQEGVFEGLGVLPDYLEQAGEVGGQATSLRSLSSEDGEAGVVAWRGRWRQGRGRGAKLANLEEQLGSEHLKVFEFSSQEEVAGMAEGAGGGAPHDDGLPGVPPADDAQTREVEETGRRNLPENTPLLPLPAMDSGRGTSPVPAGNGLSIVMEAYGGMEGSVGSESVPPGRAGGVGLDSDDAVSKPGWELGAGAGAGAGLHTQPSFFEHDSVGDGERGKEVEGLGPPVGEPGMDLVPGVSAGLGVCRQGKAITGAQVVRVGAPPSSEGDGRNSESQSRETRGGGCGTSVPVQCAGNEGAKTMEDIVEGTDGVSEMGMGCGRGGGDGGDGGCGGDDGDGVAKVSGSMSGEAGVEVERGVKSGRFGSSEDEWRIEFPRTLTDVFRVWKPAAKRRRSSISLGEIVHNS